MGKGGNQETKVSPPKSVKPAIKLGAEAAIGQFNQGPIPTFTGPRVAGFDELQQQGQQSALDFANSQMFQNQIGGAFGANLNALGGPEQLLQNPAVQAQLGAIESRANRNLLENILPNVRRSAVGAGQTFGSSEADQLQAMQIGDIQQRISDAQGDFLGGQMNSARAAQLQALGLSPQTLGLGLAQSGIFGDVGAQIQALEQAQLGAGQQEFDERRAEEIEHVNRLINRAGALAGTGQTTSVDQSGNPLTGALGGGLLAGSLLNSSLVSGFGPLAALGAGGGIPLLAGGALLGSGILG